MKILARRQFLYRVHQFISYPDIITQSGLGTKRCYSFGTSIFRGSHCMSKTTSLLNVLGSNKIGYLFSTIDQFTKYKNHKPKTPVWEFLDAHHIEYTDAPTTYKVKYCNFCPKPHYEERSNLYTLNINKDYGYFHCFRCSRKGNWNQFRDNVLGISGESTISQQFSQHGSFSGQKQNVLSEADYFPIKKNIFSQEFRDVLDYVKSRGFTQQTIKDFNIGAGDEEYADKDGDYIRVKSVYFPLYMYKKQCRKIDTKAEALGYQQKQEQQNFKYNNKWSLLVKVKCRGASKATKMFMRQIPANSPKGLFGYNLLKDANKKIVITQGQFDAMTVYQVAGLPAVSLPQGASNLPDALLQCFENFQKIILWMDNDDAGTLNVSKIAEKLGIKRTYIVKNNDKDAKDANDFLQNNRADKIIELIDKAQTIPQSNILSFGSLRNQILGNLHNHQKLTGVKVQWLPYFNQKIKGIRPGELTVVSGPTGSGKTTFLSQLFLDICQANKGKSPVLWGSFEVKNEVLMAHMLNQFSNINLTKNLSKFEYYADRFQNLPLHFMKFYGSTNIDKIISTIIYTIEREFIYAIVLDTLQFMLSGQAEGYQKFDLQDKLISKLRRLSIDYKVHIVIVIHPRKTQDGQDIGLHSIYGTSKATQEADNVWIIQNREGYKLFDIKKNRYDGELGRIPLGFNKQNKRFFQLTRSQFESVRSKQKTMRKIIEQREEEAAVKRPLSQQERAQFDDDIQDHQMNRQGRYSSKKKQENR